MSGGYRFRTGRVFIQTALVAGMQGDGDAADADGGCIATIEHLRTYLFEGLLPGHRVSSGSRRSSIVGSLSMATMGNGVGGGAGGLGGTIWERMQFWDDMFCGMNTYH